ncbi:MAG TPA: hypothetical protein PKD19_00565 [Candidatus Saccharibacteria bacterium]|nr:hypothetical protein [Candidatus Saccharibacteria bacterium]HMR38271.1 hypothetical protein [Candidatus Saccharibacteria bacterium]
MDSNQYTQPMSEPNNQKKERKGLRRAGVILLALLALTSIGYSVYGAMQNRAPVAETGDMQALQTKIGDYEKQIAELKSSAANKPTEETAKKSSDTTTLYIRELDITMELPESLGDLTYSYKATKGQNGSLAESVSFSTKYVTQQGGEYCGSENGPLGAFSKVSSLDPYTDRTIYKKYSDGSSLIYTGPHAPCSEDAVVNQKAMDGIAVLRALTSIK